MSLETVVEDIREQARARAEDIREDAESRAEEIIEEAEADAEQIREEKEREAERQIEQERDQQLSSANLQAKQERLNARRDVLETVRERVEADLEAIEGDRRRDLTEALLEAALSEFEGSGEIRVYARPEDAELLESILEEYDAHLAGERDCLGGVVVESSASQVRVNNTFDAVFEDVWEDTLRTISERLFEDTEQ